jgi:inorganic pyrophosphatase
MVHIDVGDIEDHYPGLIDATRQWFKIYKIPDGKPENTFAFDGQCKNKVRNTIISNRSIH